MRAKLRKFLEEEEIEKGYKNERYAKLAEEYKNRVNKIEKTNVKIAQKCNKQYKYWKQTATSTEKNQGLRDFELMKRDEEFKRNEMRVLYANFCEAAGVSIDQMATVRLQKEQFKEWFQAMNRHNKQHGRWVDERTDFIDEMYKLMNKQSYAENLKNADGSDKKDDEFQEFTVIADPESVEGVSMNDYKRVMMQWIRKFTEYKDNDHL